MEHGGKRKGAGRPTKQAELKAAQLGVDAIESVYGSIEAYWKHIAIESKESLPHLKLIHEYIYGKAVETKDIHIKEYPQIEINHIGDYTSIPEAITVDE